MSSITWVVQAVTVQIEALAVFEAVSSSLIALILFPSVFGFHCISMNTVLSFVMYLTHTYRWSRAPQYCAPSYYTSAARAHVEDDAMMSREVTRRIASVLGNMPDHAITACQSFQ